MRDEQATHKNQLARAKEAQHLILEAHKLSVNAYTLLARAKTRRSLGHVVIDNLPFQNDKVKDIASTLDGLAEQMEMTETDLKWIMRTLNDVAIALEQGV